MLRCFISEQSDVRLSSAAKRRRTSSSCGLMIATSVRQKSRRQNRCLATTTSQVAQDTYLCTSLFAVRKQVKRVENYLLAPELGLNLLATVGVVVVVVVVEE